LKLLTLNTHSLHSKNDLANCQVLCDFMEKELPDVVALQEVNQNITENVSKTVLGHIPTGDVPLKDGNFALFLQENLIAKNLHYEFSWLGIKRGYDRFDEGIALFSRIPVKEVKNMLLTDITDYNNFKKRMALIMETETGVFVNCHLGWEDDMEEPSQKQISRLLSCNNFKKDVYLMGDFNFTSKSIGYETTISSGFYDTFSLAEKRVGEATVSGKIDGWEENGEDMRIDYIFANKKTPVVESRVVFSGKKLPKISDHFGVMISF